MRTICLVVVVALIVAIGMAFAVGLVEIRTDHPDGKFVTTVTVNTSMIHPLTGTLHYGAHGPSDTDSPNAMDMTGKITAVVPEKDEFVVSENFKSWTFQLAADGKVFINGRESKLAELQSGDDATVTYNREGQTMLARVVRAMRK